MKVLCLTNNLDRPEAILMRSLSEQGVGMTLVLDRLSPFQELLKDSGINLIFHKFKGRIDPRSIFLVRKLIKSDNFDIIHSFSARALTSALLASCGTKIKHVAYRGTVGHLRRTDPTSWLSFFHPRLTKAICVSDAVKQYLLDKGMSAKKVVRVYKGHDVSWYSYGKPFDLSEFSIPPGTFVVSCGANVRPVKGVDILVEAFHDIPSNLPIHLLLIGEIRDGKVNEMLQNHPAKAKIHVTGFRRDAPHIMGSTTLACMPSRNREGLPKALIESMAQGLPALVTNVGGMPEVVKDGVQGLVVPAEDPKALAAAIIKLYENPDLVKSMGSKAKQQIIDNFSIQNTVKETHGVYCDCLGSTSQ